ESATRLTTQICAAREPLSRELVVPIPVNGPSSERTGERRMKTSRHKAVAAALFTVFTVQSAAPVFAHNERIHQGMTDYAYHLTLAMAAVSAGDTTSNPLVAELAAMLSDHPDLPAFFSAAGQARPKLRALRSGLLDDPMLCFDPDLLALVDDDNDLLPD